MDQFIRDFVNIEAGVTEVNNAGDYLNVIQPENDVLHFSIFHNNIRSINKNFDEMSVLLAELNYNFDCIIFTETWQVSDPRFFTIPGYSMFYNEGEINKNDGVIMYIKDIYNYNIKIVNIGEIKIIQANIPIQDNTVIVSAIYRPPITCAYEFNSNLQKYLFTLSKIKLNYHFLVGDINIDIKSNTDICQNYLNIMGEEGFRSLINSYTRIHHDSKTCIDHIFLRGSSHDICSSYIIKSQITDHFPIIARLNIGVSQTNIPVENKVRKLDKNKLVDILSRESWNEIYESDSIDYATNEFINKVKTAIDNSTSIKRINQAQRKRNPWITGGLLKSVAKKNELYKKSLNDSNNIIISNEYKKYKNLLTRLIKETKHNYYKNEIEQNKNSAKALWDVIKDFTNKKRVDTDIKQIKVNDEIITNKKRIANQFNKYFSEIGTKMASTITSPGKRVGQRNIINHSLYLYPTDTNEVVKFISELKPRKSPGLDNITSEILKTSVEFIKEPFTYIINKILQTGSFPSAFKIAAIKPLFKKGDKLDTSNYRPISLISNLAKIAEKIIKHRIDGYLTKYNLISSKQFGFRPGISTENAISYLTANVYKALDKGKQALCVFMDLAKAFDTVNHVELIETVEDLGIRGIALKLIKNYLSNRIQFVKIADHLSDPRTVECGVPQGTVLGPLLFTMYINGLLTLDTVGNITSFADDTVVFYVGDTWNELKSIAEHDLGNIKTWFDQKLLSINFKKTKFIKFTCSGNNHPLPDDLVITSERTHYNIQATSDTNYLGIQVDQHLRWDTHVNNVIKKLRPVLFQFKQLKQILNVKYLKILYHALVESQLSYGIVGWGGILKHHLMGLEILQKYFLKTIFAKDRLYPSDLLYTESQLFDIRQLFCYKMLCLQYKTKNNLKDIEHNYNTRYKCHAEIQVEKSEKTVGQRSYNYLAPRIYSTLPKDIKHSWNNTIFKKKVKNWLQNTSRYSIHNLIDRKNN